MSELSAECDRRLAAYREARYRANTATSLAKSAAMDVAYEVLLFAKAAGATVKVYARAKSLAEKAQREAHEAWAAYEQAYRALAEQDKEMPSAVAPAEGGETNIQNGKQRSDFNA